MKNNPNPIEVKFYPLSRLDRLQRESEYKGVFKMKQITATMMEIIEEIGKISMETIENVAGLQAELKKEGYISYLDASTDYLIVERD